MAIIRHDGTILTVGGAIATSTDCCCPPETCPEIICIDDQPPTSWIVEVIGVVGGHANCTDEFCGDIYNGTFAIEFRDPIGTCLWWEKIGEFDQFPFAHCMESVQDPTEVFMSIRLVEAKTSPTEDPKILITWSLINLIPSGSGGVQFDKSYTVNSQDCLAFTDLSLDFLGDSGTCDFSSATVLLTSVP